jgi:hypothetical protein
MYINISKITSLGKCPAGYLMSISNLFFNDDLFHQTSLLYDFVETWHEVEQLNVPAFSTAEHFISEDEKTVYILTSFDTEEDCIKTVKSPEFDKFTEIKIKLFEICEWKEFPRRILPKDILVSSLSNNIEEYWQESIEPEWDKS